MELKKQTTLSNMQEVKNKMLFLNHCLLLNEKHVDAQLDVASSPKKNLKHISAAITFEIKYTKFLQAIVNYEVIVHQKKINLIKMLSFILGFV